MKAAEENEINMVKFLLDNNADANAMNGKGRNVMSLAADPSGGRDTACEVLVELLKRGADHKCRDRFGLTPKDRAKKSHRTDALEIFKAYGIK